MNQKHIKNAYDFFDQHIKELNIAGLALGVVNRSGLISSKSYGFSQIQNKIPYKNNTLHFAASTSKAFTTTLLAMLHDEGLFNIYDPIKTYYPQFKMSDPYLENNATIQDFMSHITGLNHLDLAWYFNNIHKKDVLQMIAYSKPEYGFREVFAYSDVTYAFLGIIAEYLTKKTFNELIKEYIFKPLNMKHSTFLLDEALQNKNRAIGYKYEQGEIIEVPYAELHALAPAGMLATTLEDMAHWLAFNIQKGTFNNKRLLSEEMFTYLSKPRITTLSRSGIEGAYDCYAGGWFISNYKGQKLYHHSGGFDGFETNIFFSLEKELGVIVFSNIRESNTLLDISYSFIDRIFNLKLDNWKPIFDKRALQKQKKRLEKKQYFLQQLPQTSALKELNLLDFCHQYIHPVFKHLTFYIKNKHLYLDLGSKLTGIKLTPLNASLFQGYCSNTSFQSELIIQFQRNIFNKLTTVDLYLLDADFMITFYNQE